jgi:hypothetical protein
LSPTASPKATGVTGTSSTRTGREARVGVAARYLVYTNLLVYALDRREPEKRKRAREVLRRVGGAG